MGSHKGWDRHFFTNEGLVMTTGRSLNIAKGQFAVVDMESTQTQRGLAVINNFAGLPKDRKLELRLGITPLAVNRSQSNKAMATEPFKISEITGLAVNAPSTKGIGVDHFRIGYDGMNPGTAFNLENGDNENIEVVLSGQAIGMLGYTNAQATLNLYMEAPNTGAFTNQEIVEKTVERFNNMKLMGGVPVTTYVKAKAINSKATALVGTGYTFFKLYVDDNGDQSALGQVQAQYPNFEVKKEDTLAGRNTYVILAPTATVLPAYTEFKSIEMPDDCDECPAGFTLSATTGLCVSNAAVATYTWAAGEACTASTQVYNIILADKDCGDNRLAELTAAYPELVVTVSSSANSTRTVTLTGTSGTANVSVGGVNYLATYATSLEVTATNFVNANKAAILSATGATVTSNGAIITFKDATVGFPAITVANVTTNLAGTIGTITAVPSNAGCLTSYNTTVTTDIACADCSPVITELFTSEAPNDFEQISWTKVEKTYDATALMGIDFKSTTQVFLGDEQFRDSMPAIASSVRLNVSGGLPMVNESFSEGRQNRMSVKLISRATEPENYGYQFWDWENRSNEHFLGRQRFEDNNYGNLVLGQESHLKPNKQYVDYVLSVRTVRFAQSFTGEVVANFNYHIVAEVGKHVQIEATLNALATANGFAPVVAFPVVTP